MKFKILKRKKNEISYDYLIIVQEKYSYYYIFTHLNNEKATGVNYFIGEGSNYEMQEFLDENNEYKEMDNLDMILLKDYYLEKTLDLLSNEKELGCKGESEIRRAQFVIPKLKKEIEKTKRSTYEF